MVTGYIALTGKLQEVLLKLPLEAVNGTVFIEFPGAHHLLGEIFKIGKPITARFIIGDEKDATRLDIIANGSIINADNGGAYSMLFGAGVFMVNVGAEKETPDKIIITVMNIAP